MTYLFTKEGCGKCDWVKTNVDLESMKDVTVMITEPGRPGSSCSTRILRVCDTL